MAEQGRQADRRSPSRRRGCLPAVAGLLVALALIGGGGWLFRAQLLPLAAQLPVIGPLLPEAEESVEIDPLAAEQARLTAWEAELGSRRAELDQREQELVAREAAVAAREDDADRRLSEALAIAASAEKRSLELDNLIRLIEAMKPEKAVDICRHLNEDLLLQLLAHMDGEAASGILAGLEPDAAARLVEQLGPDGLAGTVARSTD